MENEKQLKQSTIKTAIVGCIVALILSILFRSFAILGGYILGALFAYMILVIDCEMADMILKSHRTSPKMTIGLFFMIKMGIYAIGFVIAVKIPVAFNIFAVFVGYLNTKLTIYRLTLTRR